MAVEGGATLTPVARATYEVRTSNAAMARRGQLVASVADVETAGRDRSLGPRPAQSAVDANNAGNAQAAVKRALETIHELNDCARRNEWTQVGWTTDELGLWKAHIGARNAAHHTSSGVIAIHSDPARDNRLRWALDAAAVNSLQFQDQAREYTARLAGHPVLPTLRAVVTRVSFSIDA